MVTEIIDPAMRREMMGLIVWSADHCARSPYAPHFTKNVLYLAGTADEMGWSDEDIDITLREIVGLGHATLSAGRYDPTDAGRAWFEAEMVVVKAMAEAKERGQVA